MNQQQLDTMLREMAREALEPPPTPREEIWARLQAARDADRFSRRRQATRLRRWIQWGVGIAAVLLMGVGLGRFSLRPGTPQRLADGGPSAAAPAPAAYRVLAAQHLSQAEALLTLTRSAADTEQLDRQTIVWATDLLSTTRLLLDSPVARDPKLHALLQDLELLLAEIAQLPASGPDANAREELELVKKSIQNGSVLPRLRTAIPAGAPTAAS